MTTTVVLLALLVVAIVFGSGRSKRRRTLDELGLGADTPPSTEQIYDPNSFEHTGPSER